MYEESRPIANGSGAGPADLDSRNGYPPRDDRDAGGRNGDVYSSRDSQGDGRRSPGPRRGSDFRGPPRPRHAPADPEPSNVLGCFGLSTRTGERELEDEFSRIGRVEKVVIVYDQRSGQSRGFGFVTMETVDDAAKARAELNGIDLQGRNIRVDFSVTQRPHNPTPGEYMGFGRRRDDRRDDYRRSRYDDRRSYYDDDRDRRYGGGGGGYRRDYSPPPRRRGYSRSPSPYRGRRSPSPYRERRPSPSYADDRKY